MPPQKGQLITHPVRARILTALMGRQLTTGQVAQLVPDVPLSSIYRHVRVLADGGIVEAVDEVTVNGAPTRVYAVRQGQARIAPAETEGATRGEHLAYFTRFLNILAEIDRAYLEREDADPRKDPIHALMGPLHLTTEEYHAFMDALSGFLEPWRRKNAGGGRHRLVFAHVMIPDRPDPPLCERAEPVTECLAGTASRET